MMINLLLLNALCLTLIAESDIHPDHSESVVPVLIFCDVPTIPKLIPMMIASDDPVLGKLVELVKMVGSVIDMDVAMLWI